MAATSDMQKAWLHGCRFAQLKSRSFMYLKSAKKPSVTVSSVIARDARHMWWREHQMLLLQAWHASRFHSVPTQRVAQPFRGCIFAARGDSHLCGRGMCVWMHQLYVSTQGSCCQDDTATDQQFICGHCIAGCALDTAFIVTAL